MGGRLVNLIVNYLPDCFTEDDLHGLFEPYGRIAKIKIVRNEHGKSLSYGFVEYYQLESAFDAINNLNGLRIYNRILKVSYASPRLPASQRAKNLFIENLPKSITEDELENIFGPFGKIIYIRKLYEPTTLYTTETNSERLSNGIALVRFEKLLDSINAAETLNNTIPPGFQKPIKIKMHENTPKKSSVSRSLKSNGELETINCNQNNKILSTELNSACQSDMFSIEQAAGIHTNVSMVPNNHIYASKNEKFVKYYVQPSAGKNLLVRNINPRIDEITLFSLFKPYGALWVTIARYRDGKSRQYGFVEVKSMEDALKAIHGLNGTFFFGYKLTVKQNNNIDSMPYSICCSKISKIQPITKEYFTKK